jgi:hypothetical protein
MTFLRGLDHGYFLCAGNPCPWLPVYVKTILSRCGGNELVSGATRGLFQRWQNSLHNSRTAASYRTLSEIARIARTAKIAKSASGNSTAAANEDTKENACIRSSFVL